MSKYCQGCVFANWKRAANNRLHPSGEGRCTYLDKHPLNLAIPEAFYWGWTGRDMPAPSGGYIERNVPLKNDCTFKQVPEQTLNGAF